MGKRDKNNKYTVQYLVDSFLGYFRDRGHEIVPSAPLLPQDPTLLFTAAGMVPFKAYYSDPNSAPSPRAASVQKCLRAGGKQSDLENVGRTLRHHTFFEMLGNFSFGDYFKKEAIEWGWDLSVEVWEMDPTALWVSVYTDDDEAYDLWTRHIGFPKDRVVRLGKSDNFWGPVGDTGVCGPSSEMYVDTGEERGCGKKTCAPGCDCDRYIEYWNLVFPQFFYTEAGAYDPLPKPGIDTGLGLERVAFVLQGAKDNFHTNEFLPIRQAVAGAIADRSRVDAAAVAINVASDHVRALTFALAEGIMPSNEGRGYVLRRLLRRAVTKMQPFGVEGPFLGRAVDAVLSGMGGRYPEVRGRGKLVKEVIGAEEERFFSTLEQGLDRFAGIVERTTSRGEKTIAGEDAFLLYDTFGFPPELTEEMALEKGLGVDRAGFDRAMAAQKERGRRSSFHVAGAEEDAVFIELEGHVGRSEFVGYDELSCDAAIVAFRVSIDETETPLVELVTDTTPFYAESGGQVGDAGSAKIDGKTLRVGDTYYEGDRTIHAARWPSRATPDEIETFLREHHTAELSVDRTLRASTMRNHTATHLLHAALRRVLGEHVAQAGSLVAPERLRFDFHHFQAMRPEEVAEVERIVNWSVLADLPVTKRVMPYKQAVDAGAMALFGEKYGDKVRVVSVGDISMELCGGTHLERTGEIGAFLVRQESAIGAGIRRIEALTGEGTLGYVIDLVRERERVARLLRVAPEDVERRVRALVEETESLQRRVRESQEKMAKERAGEAASNAADIKGVRFVSMKVDAPDVGALRKYGDELRGKLGVGMGLLCQNKDEKPVVLIVASDKLIKDRSVTANDMARRIGEALSHRGGGKPHMAQVGIGRGAEFDEVDAFVRSTLDDLL